MHSLAGSRRDGQAQKTAILNYTHTQTEGGGGADIGGSPKCGFFVGAALLDVGASGCTYQAGRAPACPVVPILNTCQQKLSSPTCFKHQTCNYHFTPKTHSQLPLSSVFSDDNLNNGKRFGGASEKPMSLGPRRCFASEGRAKRRLRAGAAAVRGQSQLWYE